ncbi:3'(2'),5'-bisphosphate nucleotidase CysQ [Sinorhizobium medicae]|uniref:3'(2'),5'-bisphosphate nucleotidase CysQ n=1 Tax=Sinorhizobium medicae TaxID=110321 RepID=A0A508X2P6_9HYPH|nr:3'(2'),5'-bisphosphate nucleotidase CysQ [Sinorhizobium medicae]MDX0520581.1 3'(2'),5'-bisphosphate nucleotidase CysQ [Sinorhizobium medicae]MDX0547445.1 3'(2'),5'-bisphosphate nucleotidase CysQ [Sinorhizobium medicae]MDX0630955.1 3'(2'),5'-bisphosphate nucleotidase CysQ [Sinorhizobium medicae]MDX0714750.1 3'(2'),5'-bisphosphate nucleotidase CysQ [Sinorhizobium medicae]MDX0767187.1 3'(2'),5'-bisphosphate nucleotidase CysQ [Sinorhizobium medicae]
MTPLCQIFEHIALEAGAAILEVYDAGPEVCYKDDQSPVTEADERAEAIILERLAAAFPGIPVVAEESVCSGRVPDISGGLFFLVDPLDGTKEFINRRSDFTVNIALIKGNVPVAGIVYAPAQRCAYVADGGRAEKLLLDKLWALEHRQPIRVRMRGAELTAVASRSHNSSETEAFLTGHGVMNYASVGSSLKFCLLAEGKADVYPRFGRTMEWDTAAGDAVLRAAGGSVVRLDGSRLLYGKTMQDEDSDFANPHFIAWADMSPVHLTAAEGVGAAHALT